MITDLAVIVPAADEQDHIGECLDAIREACIQLHVQPRGRRVRTRVIVVLDACRDASADIVAQRPGVVSVTATARNVGAARRLGADHALKHRDFPAAIWLANTDADSVVPPHWLIHMVDAGDTGYDLVLGTVRPGSGLPLTIEQDWLDQHHLGEGHPHVHGANFGVRASTYLDAGGWQPYRSSEDVDLADRIQRNQAAIQRTAAIPVVTSSRMHGRAPSASPATSDNYNTAARHHRSTTPLPKPQPPIPERRLNHQSLLHRSQAPIRTRKRPHD
jgi:glycosyltransferase involved in cell wall biosynthesis